MQFQSKSGTTASTTDFTQLTFVGTGAATDFGRTNASFHLSIPTDKEHFGLQVDAGPTVPPALQKIFGADALAHITDLLLLTHLHGDHTGGIPSEVLGMYDACARQNLRDRVLHISGEPNALALALADIERAYPKFLKELFEEHFEVRAQQIAETPLPKGVDITSGLTNHGQVVRNYAFRIGLPNGFNLVLTGDGALTNSTRDLVQGAHLLVADGFNVSNASATHETVANLLKCAQEAHIPRVAVVHMQASERGKVAEINALRLLARDTGISLWLPNDGEQLILSPDLKIPFPDLDAFA